MCWATNVCACLVLDLLRIAIRTPIAIRFSTGRRSKLWTSSFRRREHENGRCSRLTMLASCLLSELFESSTWLPCKLLSGSAESRELLCKQFKLITAKVVTDLLPDPLSAHSRSWTREYARRTIRGAHIPPGGRAANGALMTDSCEAFRTPDTCRHRPGHADRGTGS